MFVAETMDKARFTNPRAAVVEIAGARR